MRPAVPLQEDPRALVAQQPQLRAAVGGRAVVGHLQLAPARPVLRQEEIVREVGGVGHGERVGGEELRRGDRARARHVAAHHAARRHSAACGREGAAQALAVQRARGGRTGDGQRGARERPAAKLAAVAAPKAVSVPVDTSPTVVKFPALAVLLMVSVLPVIPAAELSRPTLAAPLMLSELPDTAPVDDSAAPATAPAVSAAQEMAPEASTPVVNTSVQFTSLHSSWSQPTLPCAVSPSSVAEPVRASESASRSVTETDSPSKAEALICMLYRSSVPADCCTSPGIDPPKAPKCSFAIPPSGTEKSRRAVLQTPCEAVPRKVPVTPM